MSLQNKNLRIKCNVLLIGKSGAGKSSFANYLFGVEKFTTGSGLPVTTWEENFQNWMLVQDGVEINVYDSVGLENNTGIEWIKRLNGFLENMQGNGFSIKKANDILHIFFYVINAASARVEDYEIDTINGVKNNYEIPTSVILTNCDNARENEIMAIENRLKSNCRNTEIIRVCSISRKTRAGQVTKPFGKEQAIAKVLAASYEKVGKDLLLATFDRAEGLFRTAQSEIKTIIEESDISFFNMLVEAIQDENAFEDNRIELLLKPVFDKMEKLGGTDKDLVPKSYRTYFDFIEKFPVQWRGRNIFEEGMSLMDDFTDFSGEDLALAKAMDKATNDIEYGDFWEKIKGVFVLGRVLLSLKSSLNEAIDEIFSILYRKIHWVKLSIEKDDKDVLKFIR